MTETLETRETRLVERKMTVNKLPEDTTHYWAWRVHVVGELIQHVPFETEPGRLFVEKLDTSNFDELGDPLPAVLTATDSKILTTNRLQKNNSKATSTWRKSPG